MASACRALLILNLALMTAPAPAAEPEKESSPDRTNVLLIMADDLGFSDLGCYGGEINTPHLDSLAEGGLRFTQYYNTGRCWPTRAALMTGYYPQSVRRDAVPGVPSGGRGQRPEWAPLLCRPLGDAGYRTYHSGKWHLDNMPIAAGFDRSYLLKDQHRFFSPTRHFEDDQRLPPVEPDSGFYGTTAIGDHAVKCLQEHQREHSDKPFFHYLAFTAPHFPLHALPDDIKRYRDTYPAGWKKIRQRRWKRLQQMGIVQGRLSPVMRDVGPPYHFPDDLETLGPAEVDRPLAWEELTAEQQEFQATKMAIHAAMVDCMDRQIGRVLEQLRAMNRLDNTLVMFLSDNGASAEIMVRGDGHDREAPMGSWKSHLCLGPGWSTTSNTPFRYHKTWVHEGGIATPLIAHWPERIADRGALRDTPGHAIDVWPTVLEAAGVSADSLPSGPERPGESLLPIFAGETPAPAEPRTLWWSHEGNRALRHGDWKISAVDGGPWELYRLDGDRTETDNLAERHPEKLQTLIDRWEALDRRHVEMATDEYR